MTSVKREPIKGVWGQSPQQGQGQSPWWGSGGRSPPEAERVLAVGRPVKRQISLILCIFKLQTTGSFFIKKNCKLYREKAHDGVHRGMLLLFFGKGVVAVIVKRTQRATL